MDLVMNNEETEAAIRLYLQARNIITNGEELDIDITKLRNADGGVSTTVRILDDTPVAANSTTAPQPETIEPELVNPESESDPEPEPEEVPDPEPEGSAEPSSSDQISSIFAN